MFSLSFLPSLLDNIKIHWIKSLSKQAASPSLQLMTASLMYYYRFYFNNCQIVRSGRHFSELTSTPSGDLW